MRSLILILFAGLQTLLCSAQAPSITFDHQALLVGDLDRSAAFYQNVMGLMEIEDKTGQPHIRWFAMGHDKQLHIIETTSEITAPPKGVHMAFSTNNMEAMTQHLKANNVYFENWSGLAKTTNSRPDGVKQIYLQDPDGYWIEINGQ